MWNGDVSFTVTQNKTLWGGEGPVLTLNSAVTFSSVLTNVGTAVMKINFFKKIIYSVCSRHSLCIIVCIYL